MLKKINLVCLCALLSFSAMAQIDTDFWFAIPNLTSGHESGPFSFFIYTLEDDAQVTITQPANSSFSPVVLNVPANDYAEYQMAADYAGFDAGEFQVLDGKVSNRGFHVQSNVKIGCYYQIAGNNGEAYTLKGKNALGRDFIVPMQSQVANPNQYTPRPYSSIELVAAEDNTEVTIYPSSSMNIEKYGSRVNVTVEAFPIGTYPPANTKNDWYELDEESSTATLRYYFHYVREYQMIMTCESNPFTITLNRGETFSAKSCGQEASRHLGGTRITSTKPIAVNSTDDSVLHGGSKDAVGDQILPIEFAGTEYIAIHNGTNFEGVYIYALEDGTSVWVNEAKTETNNMEQITSNLNIGEVKFVPMYNYCYSNKIKSPLYIKADKPIIVFQETGRNAESGGTMLPQLSCTGSEKAMYKRVPDSKECVITIITRSEFVNDFVLNGDDTAISGADFTPVRGHNTWSYLKITEGEPLDDKPISIANKSGYFHASVLDRDGSSCTFGFFSTYQPSVEMKIKEIDSFQDTILVKENASISLSVDDEILSDLSGQSWLLDDVELSSGTTFTIDDFSSDNEGTYVLKGQSTLECGVRDRRFVLKMLKNVVDTTHVKVCGAINYDFYGSIYSESGFYTYKTTNPETGQDTIRVLALEVNTIPTLTISTPEVINCKNTSVVLTLSPVITSDVLYSWNGAAGVEELTYKVDSKGVYNVVATNTVTGCSASASVSVSEDVLQPKAVLSSANRLSCSVKTLTLSVSVTNTPASLLTYEWVGLNDSHTYSNLASANGDFSVKVKNTANFCENEFKFTVESSDDTPKAKIEITDSLTCVKEKVLVTANLISIPKGEMMYTWSSSLTNTENVAEVYTGGNYAVTITDKADNCEAVYSFSVYENKEKPVAVLSSDEILTCQLTEVSMNVSLITTSLRGVTYNWSNGTTTSKGEIKVSVAGDYSVTLVDNFNQCSVQYATEVKSNIDAPEVSIVGNELLTCLKKSIELQAQATLTGGLSIVSYKWSNNVNTPNATISKPGEYIVSVGFSNGCVNTSKVNVEEGDKSQPAVQPITGRLLVCEQDATVKLSNLTPGGKWRMEGIANASIDENTGLVTFSEPGQAQIYYTVVGTNGCETTVEAILDIDAMPQPEFPQNVTICEGSSTEVSVSGAESYFWSPNESISTPYGAHVTLSPETNKTYEVTFINGVCSDKRDVAVTVVENPTVDVTIEEMTNQVTLAGNGGLAPYNFAVDNTNYSFENIYKRLSEGVHTAYVKDENGCLGEANFDLVYLDIEIPIFFSPNADGINDMWVVQNLQMYPEATIQIFDRYGKCLLESLGCDFEGWDGTYRGVSQPSSDYWFVINLNFENKKYINHFTLKR